MFKQALDNEMWTVRETAFKDGIARGLAQGFLFGLSCAIPLVTLLLQPVAANSGQECIGLVENVSYTIGTAHCQYFSQNSIFGR